MKWLMLIPLLLVIAACDNVKNSAGDQDNPTDIDTTVVDTDEFVEEDTVENDVPLVDDAPLPEEDNDVPTDDDILPDDSIINTNEEILPDSEAILCHIGDHRCSVHSPPENIELCGESGWSVVETCDPAGVYDDCYEYYDTVQDSYNAVCNNMWPDGTIHCRIGDVRCTLETHIVTCVEENDWIQWKETGSCMANYDICAENFVSGHYEAHCTERECQNDDEVCFGDDVLICENERWTGKEDCTDKGLTCYYTSENTAECQQPVTDDAKPNIYLYPTAPLDITVKIGFPRGGHVTVSEPLYNDGWTVRVTPDSLIDGQWRFLFYESVQPNGWQRERGYLVATDEMEEFFRNDLAARGFVGQEIEDFIDWWMPLLAGPGYLIVYPQDDTVIRTLEDLQLSVTPDSLLRHRYVIETTAEPVTIEPPDAPAPLTRDGFTVTEWGVIRL